MRKTLEELEEELDTVRVMVGIREDGRGRVFQHRESGDYYVAVNVGFNEDDMTPQVEYHPLRSPRVRFHRPFNNFSSRFNPVNGEGG